MFEIIQAHSIEDLGGVLRCRKIWAAETKFRNINLQCDEERFMQSFLAIFNNLLGYVFIARRQSDKAFLGVIVGEIKEFYGNYVMSEEFWYVLPEYRGSKIGKTLLNALWNVAKHEGIKHLLFTANFMSSDKYENLKSMYAKLGAQEVTTQFLLEV